MTTNEIISPYFENGAFAGVRVTSVDEDFVIAPKDYSRKMMNWYDAMDVLKSNGLDTWNYQQCRLVCPNYEEIEKVLRRNGGEYLNVEYWTCTEYSNDAAFYYDGYYNQLRWDTKTERCYVRPIKNLKTV